MADYKPQNPEEHFALQRTTRAAEVVKAVFEAQQKGNEESRGRDERFYNSLALFSSGTVALSITYLGYLKNLPKPIQHPHWLMACWICLLTCVLCSLFWLLAQSHYAHYFHEWQTANAQKEQYEAEAKEYPVLARNAISVQTRAAMSAQEIASFVSNREGSSFDIREEGSGCQRPRELLHAILARAWVDCTSELHQWIRISHRFCCPRIRSRPLPHSIGWPTFECFIELPNGTCSHLSWREPESILSVSMFCRKSIRNFPG
jgi:hypothetical protein